MQFSWLRVVGVDLKVGDSWVTRERLGHGRRVRTEPNCGPNLDKLSSDFSDLASLHGNCRSTERPVTGMGMHARERVHEFRLFPGINKATDPPWTNSSSLRQLPAYIIRLTLPVSSSLLVLVLLPQPPPC
jgi:hypothetical protein